MRQAVPRILVTGASGMLGSELVATLEGAAEVVAVDVGDFDISDAGAVDRAVHAIEPTVIANCAAFTDVDGAEAAPETAFAVNAAGAGNVARAGTAVGAFVLHVSTDYVFDGSKKEPYREEDPPHPLNVYGESKLAGEREVLRSGARSLIVRTAWLYGHRGRNFVETILSAAEREGRLRVVDDQWGAPTNATDLAIVMRELLGRRPTGTLHATNSGRCSWHGFALEILRAAGLRGIEIEPVASVAFPRPARRPANSVLSLERLSSVLGWTPRPWEEALEDFVNER